MNKFRRFYSQSKSFQMSLFDFKAKDIDGNTFDFSTLKGKVCLVVNVASF